jgi:hypothetical protein
MFYLPCADHVLLFVDNELHDASIAILALPCNRGYRIALQTSLYVGHTISVPCFIIHVIRYQFCCLHVLEFYGQILAPHGTLIV